LSHYLSNKKTSSKDEQFTRDIKACIKKTGTNYNEVADAVGIGISTFYSKLRNPESITVRELRALIREINILEEDVIKFLYLENDEVAG
jgi:predicted transcriptional regulator